MSIQSHLLLMTVFAFCVALVGGVMLKDTVRQQVRAGAEIFGGLMAGAIILGWILYVFPL
jgi:undecaprenyl pyrophosphate phosphatase UppP